MARPNTGSANAARSGGPGRTDHDWLHFVVACLHALLQRHRALARAASAAPQPTAVGRLGRGERNTIVAHMKHIRDAFRAGDPGLDAIRTERGAGYRWLDG